MFRLILLLSTLGPADGGTDDPTPTSDGGVMRENFVPWADLSWTWTEGSSHGNEVNVVWVDDRRDVSFGTARRRDGGDLWTNRWLPDAGLSAPFGQLVCFASANELFSRPRVATDARGETVVVWTAQSTAGHSIRAAKMTDSGALTSCSTALVAPSSTPLSGLQLRESNGAFLAIWETPEAVMAQLVVAPSGSPAPPAFVVALKPQGHVLVHPSLTAVNDSFFAAWTLDGGYSGAFISPLVSPQAVRTSSYFSGARLIDGAIALSSPLALGGAFVGPAASNPSSSQLFAGLLTPLIAVDSVSSRGPLVGPRPLLGAALSVVKPRLYVAHQTADRRGFEVSEFSEFDAGVQTISLPVGFEPLAMVAAGRGVIMLTSDGPTLSVQPVIPRALGLRPVLGEPISNASSTNQLAHSGAWTDGGVFIVGWNEGRDVTGALLTTTGELKGFATNWARDAGVITLHQVAHGPGFAAKRATASGTAIYPAALGQGLTAPAWLESVGSLQAAVVGEEMAAMWSPGADTVSAGRGVVRPKTWSGVRFGRCGAHAQGSIWIPAIKNGTDLGVLELVDGVDPRPQLHTVGSASRLIAPCLAARGTSLLIVATDARGELVVASTTVAEVRNGLAPKILALPGNPMGRAVVDPVAARSGTGWQLAWESPDEVSTTILGMSLGLDGAVLGESLLGNGAEDRAPVLVPSSEGSVALLYQHFVDRSGSVMVKTKVFIAPVTTTDGGVTDGGVTIGETPDGGIDLVFYPTCGCQTGDASALLALALIGLARPSASGARRRSPRTG